MTHCPSCLCHVGDVVYVKVHQSLIREMNHGEWSQPIRVQIQPESGGWEMIVQERQEDRVSDD